MSAVTQLLPRHRRRKERRSTLTSTTVRAATVLVWCWILLLPAVSLGESVSYWSSPSVLGEAGRFDADPQVSVNARGAAVALWVSGSPKVLRAKSGQRHGRPITAGGKLPSPSQRQKRSRRPWRSTRGVVPSRLGAADISTMKQLSGRPFGLSDTSAGLRL